MKVLLIENDSNYISLVKKAFPEVYFFVTTSVSGAKIALDINNYNLILLDLGLDDSYGKDTIENFSSIGIPTVIITGIRGLEKDIAAAGYSDYIEKTSDFDRFLERVRFNIEKFKPRPKLRVRPENFEKIRDCFILT